MNDIYSPSGYNEVQRRNGLVATLEAVKRVVGEVAPALTSLGQEEIGEIVDTFSRVHIDRPGSASIALPEVVEGSSDLSIPLSVKQVQGLINSGSKVIEFYQAHQAAQQ